MGGAAGNPVFTAARYAQAAMGMFLLLVTGLTFGLLVSGWRLWDYLRWWQRAEARTLSSDYSTDEQRDDQAPFAFLRPHPWSDQQGNRRTLCRVEYTDDRGELRRANIVRYIRRGRSVPPAMRIYYDRRDPAHVSFTGAIGASVGMLLWGSTLVWVIHRAMAVPSLLA